MPFLDGTGPMAMRAGRRLLFCPRRMRRSLILGAGLALAGGIKRRHAQLPYNKSPKLITKGE